MGGEFKGGVKKLVSPHYKRNGWRDILEYNNNKIITLINNNNIIIKIIK